MDKYMIYTTKYMDDIWTMFNIICVFFFVILINRFRVNPIKTIVPKTPKNGFCKPSSNGRFIIGFPTLHKLIIQIFDNVSSFSSLHHFGDNLFVLPSLPHQYIYREIHINIHIHMHIYVHVSIPCH